MHETYRVLVINPQTNTTKIGVYDNESCLYEKTIVHHFESKPDLINQVQLRKDAILAKLIAEGINISKFATVVGRGGLLQAIEGGTYVVNAAMRSDLESGYNGIHAANLGGLIADDIASGLNIQAYIVDPVVVDELAENARYTGFPDMKRKSIFHALSQKAAARKAAHALDITYEQARMIVVHIGGGITVGAHQFGKVIDVNNGLHGDGPFSPERAGTLPAQDLIALCFSGEFDEKTLMQKIVGNGGLMAYLHTNELKIVEDRMKQGDKLAKEVYEAMVYQVAKEIGAMATVLSGQIDAIVLTGRFMQPSIFVDLLFERVKWIADIFIYPGENEMQALNAGALRILRGEEVSKQYVVTLKYKGARLDDKGI